MCRPRIQAIRKRVPDASGLTALTAAGYSAVLLVNLVDSWTLYTLFNLTPMGKSRSYIFRQPLQLRSKNH